MAVLTTNLISYWELDDGTDSHGSNTLLNQGSATFSAGVQGDAANFNGTTQYLYKTSVTPPGAMTVAFWAKPTSDIFQAWMAQLQSSVNQSWTIFSYTDLGFFCRIHSEATATQVFIGRFGGDVITGTWQFVAITYNGAAAASGIKIYQNNTQIDTADSNAGSFTSQVVSAGYLTIGTELDGDTNMVIPLSGSMDEIGWWGRVLNTNEITWLYNAGTGRSYAAVAAAGDVSGGEEPTEILMPQILV